LAQQIVQAVHAAHDAGREFGIDNRSDDRRFSVVICQVPSEQHLMVAYEKLIQKGIRASLFREPDIGNQATALATEPTEYRNLFSKYPLWKG
jgi:hypothetical protein